MSRLLFLVFLAVPLIEIGLFIVIGNAIGLWPTLGGVVLMALLGTYLLRAQGMALFTEMRTTMARGQLPARTLADAFLVAVAGMLLLLPGYFSDLIGILLLIPPVRTAIYAFLLSRARIMPTATGTDYSWRPSGPTANSNDRGNRSRPAIDLDDKDWRER